MWEYAVLEYSYVKHDELGFRNKLNELGNVGWELVSTQVREHHIGDFMIICIFKRRTNHFRINDNK